MMNHTMFFPSMKPMCSMVMNSIVVYTTNEHTTGILMQEGCVIIITRQLLELYTIMLYIRVC